MDKGERHAHIFTTMRAFLGLVTVYVRQSLEPRPSVESIIACATTERDMAAAFLGLVSLCGVEQYVSCEAMDAENAAKGEEPSTN